MAHLTTRFTLDRLKGREWLLWSLFAVYALGLGLALLAPFDFYLPLRANQATWDVNKNGLTFARVSVARTETIPRRLYERLATGTGFSLDVRLQTASLDQHGPARIVSYSWGKTYRNFTLGQEGASLVLRLRTTATNLDGSDPHLMVPDVFEANTVQHVVLTYDFNVLHLYVNGEHRLSSTKTQGRFLNWDEVYPLLLGNETTGDRPWQGTIQAVSIYDRPLLDHEILVPDGDLPDGKARAGLVVHYDFKESPQERILDQSGEVPPISLVMPKLIAQYRSGRGLFIPPSRNFSFSLKYVLELVGNILIFVPIGYLLSRIMMRRRTISPLVIIGGIILAGALYSVLLETIQFPLRSRISSVTDVMYNSLGTAVGVGLDWARRWASYTCASE